MQPALAVEIQDPATPKPAIPARIGRFVIREEIGRGSNGVVYAATDPVLGRDIAIKAIPLDPLSPAQHDVEAGFLQEAKIAAGLNHPSIVTVFDAGKTETIAYIAMERLHGSDLHHWLVANRPMSAESAAALIARVSDAVHFAHRRGLIHRDIKPSNIFLGRDLKPKVLDFGIALAQGKQGNPDEPPKLIGTPNYMSPEQALGRPLDARSDVFSIGAILYEVITGHRAFDGANVDEILTKVVKSDPPPLTDWRPDLSPLIGEIVFRALAKNPANRYQTAAQLRNDLAAFAGRPFPPGTSPPGELAASPPRAGFHLPGPGPLIATGCAIVGLTLTFAFWYWSHRADPDGDSPPTVASAARPSAPETAPPAMPPALQPATPPSASAPGTRLADARSAAAATARAEPDSLAARPSDAPRAPRASAGHAAHKATAKPAPAPPPPEPGTLSLAVAPWGQVFLDGADMGVSPPLNRLNLGPGTHEVELRNGAAPVFHTQIAIESGKILVLQHRF
jgi:serine/threonine-protein kinase